MRARRTRMDQAPVHEKKHTSRPRRLFAALWVLAILFIGLWLVVVVTSSMAPSPNWHSSSNHVARDIVDGDALVSRQSPELAAADSAAMGRILLATHQRGCQTVDLHNPSIEVIMRRSRNIWFIRTSNEKTLDLLSTCAVASAAEKNPDSTVWLLSNHLSCRGLSRSGAPIVLVRFDYARAFAGYPALLRWFEGGAWRGKFESNNLGNALRLVLLHQFGGLYLDTDILSLRPATDLVNAVGIETEQFLNNAVLAFDAGHPYVLEAISRFVSGFKQVWGQQGPRLVTRTWREAPDELVNRASVQLLPVHELYGVGYRARQAFGQRPAENRVLARKVYRAARLVHLWNKQTKSLFQRIEAAETSERASDQRRAGSWFLSVLMQDACPAMAPFMDQYVPAAAPGAIARLDDAVSSADADVALLGELRALLKKAPAAPTAVVDGVIEQRHRGHPGLAHGGPGDGEPESAANSEAADKSVSAVVPWDAGGGDRSPWDRIISVGEMGTVLQRVPYSVLHANKSRAAELHGEHLRVGRLRSVWRCRTPLAEVATAMEDLVSLQALSVAETQGYKEAGGAGEGESPDAGGAADASGDGVGGEGDPFGVVAKDETPGDPAPLLPSEVEGEGGDEEAATGSGGLRTRRPHPAAAAGAGIEEGEEGDSAGGTADGEEEEDGADEEDEENDDGAAGEEETGGWGAGGAASALLSSLGLGGRRLFDAAAPARKRVRYPAALPRQHAIVATGSLSLDLASITGTPLHVGCGLVAPLPSAPLPRLGPGFAPGTTGHAFMVSMWVRTTATTIDKDACPAVLCGAAVNAGRPDEFCQVLISQRAATAKAGGEESGAGAAPAALPLRSVSAERGAIPLAGEMRKRSFRLSADKGHLSFQHPFPSQPQGLSPQTRLVKRGWRVSTKIEGAYATGSWRHVALIYNGALTVTCDEEAPPLPSQSAGGEAAAPGDAALAGLPGAAEAMRARAGAPAGGGPECSLPRYTYAHKWSLFLDALLEETAGQSGTVVAPADLADGGTLLPRYLTLAAGFGDSHDLQIDGVAVYGPGLFSQDDVAAARNAGLQHRRERIDAALCSGQQPPPGGK